MSSKRISENYLKAVLILQKRSPIVRSVDVAKKLGITKATVSFNLRALKQEDLIRMGDKAPYALNLTEKGKAVAEQVYKRYCFFVDWLVWSGVDREKAEADACELEHAISQESFELIRSAMEKRYNAENVGA